MVADQCRSSLPRIPRRDLAKIAYKGDCSNIRAAISLLAWLDTQHVTLLIFSNGTWIHGRMTSPACEAAPSPSYAGLARHLATAPLTLNHPPSQLMVNFDAEDVHAQQLRRYLNDTSLPRNPHHRAMVRLYALPLTKIVELTADQFCRATGHAFLTIRDHPVLIPPKLARIIDDYLPHPAPGKGCEHDTRYLLPGQHPGQPRNPPGLADAMLRYSLPARAAQNTAMIQALADLPQC